MRPVLQSGSGGWWATSCTLVAAACSPGSTSVPADTDLRLDCSISSSEIFDGGPGKDGIPALTNPPLVPIGDPGMAYVRDSDRVIGLEWQGGAVAVPLNIGWWHEIVNLDLNGLSVAITHCPLTGSSLAFDRTPAGGAAFGVSGLLYLNNLIMYDRNDPASLWPQMARGARCGPRDGTTLPMVPVVEMTWSGWRSLHPGTLVVSDDNGYTRDYSEYPYGTYDEPDNSSLLFPIRGLDRRRPLKERVLGVPSADGTRDVAFPFGELSEAGSVAAVHWPGVSGEPFVVFWNAELSAAMAFHPVVGTDSLTFEVRGASIADVETGSLWSVDGRARAGPLAGMRLEAVSQTHVAFWFAWSAFHRDADTWSAGT